MREWPNRAVSKTVVSARAPWVRIPLPPPLPPPRRGSRAVSLGGMPGLYEAMGGKGTRSEREQRFAELFHETVGQVAAFVRRRVPASEVDDIVAEVFLTAWRHFDKLEETEGAALPWLYRTARHATLHSRRGASRRQGLLRRLGAVRELETAQPGEIFAWSDGFAQAFGALRAGDREVLRLAIWEGLDSSQAAAVLGCTPGAFQVRAHRARKRLRRRLERSGVILPDQPAVKQTGRPSARQRQALVFKEDTP